MSGTKNKILPATFSVLRAKLVIEIEAYEGRLPFTVKEEFQLRDLYNVCRDKMGQFVGGINSFTSNVGPVSEKPVACAVIIHAENSAFLQPPSSRHNSWSHSRCPTHLPARY